MWSPTHVQVTVQRARGLLTKGKNGTNDAFVTIALGKEKYQTSVKEKASQDVEWHEECELTIPKQGNVAEIILTALHRNFLGVDEFLGVIHIPLADFDVYERPRNRWYELKSKPGKEKKKSRGELEVRVGFLVKAGSLTDLSKKEKHKSSLGQLSHMAHTVGGSLLSIGSIEKRKSLKKLAKSIVAKNKKRKENAALEDQEFNHSQRMSLQEKGDADPGVISEGESDYEFSLDDLSYKSSGSSLNANQPAVTPLSGSLENLAGGEFLRRTSTLPNSNPSTYANTAPSKPARNLSSNQERSLDEWEQKLYGKQGKDIYATNLETLKRRSWENPKAILSSQPEEEESEEVKGSSSSVPSTPVQQWPPTSHVTVSHSKKQDDMTVSPQPEVEKKDDEKEKPKEGSKLARKFKHFRKENKHLESSESRSVVHDDNAIDGINESVPVSRLSPHVLQQFEGKSREDLIEMISGLQNSLEHKEKKLKDLEDYLDNLLLRVMETTPRILQNPYVSCKTQAKLSH